MSLAVVTKDPQAVIDYTFDWNGPSPGPWLGSGETINTSTWTPPSGITVASTSSTASTATVWLSGGTDGQDYDIVNRIVTNQGRTDERTLTVRVRNK